MRRRHIIKTLIAAMGAVIPGLAIADPVSVIALGAQLAAAGSLGAALTISAATAAWIGVGAAVFGMSQARKQQRRAAAAARSAAAAAIEDRTVRAATNTPPRVTIYGRAPTGGYPGDVLASDATHTLADGTTRIIPDGLRHVVVVWSGRECHQIAGLWFEQTYIPAAQIGPDGWALPGSPFAATREDKREITLSPGTHTLPSAASSVLSCVVSAAGDGGDEPAPYTLSSGGTAITIGGAATARVTYLTSVSSSYLRVSHHLGTAGQTVDTYLAGITPTRYTSAHRLRGLCYSVITYDLRYERWQAGLPNPVADIYGAKVYDPRTGLTAWSDNAALCTLDHLLAADGWAADIADIDMPSVISAANACDQQITNPVGAGTAARYTCNGVVDTSAAREAVLDDLCRAMAGNALYAGVWRLSAGIYTPPVLDLTDDDLAGSISIVQAGAPDDQLTNGIRGVYIPAGGVSAIEIEPYQNAALLAADGGRERWLSVDLPFTDASWRARNIGRVMMEEARNGLVISYPGKLHLMRLQPGDRVRVTARDGAYQLFTDKVFRVTDSSLAPRGVALLTLQEDGPDAWDEVDTSSADPTPNTSLPDPWTLAAPTAVTADSGNDQLIVQSDGTIVPRVLVSWATPPESLADSLVLKWSRASGGEATTVTVPADQGGVYLSGLAEGQAINIELYLLSRFARSPIVYLSHTVIGKSAPPPAIPSLTVIQSTSGSRHYHWDYLPGVLDLKQFEARYWSGPTLPIWDAMNTIFTAGPGERSRESTLPPNGTHYISMLAVDTSGNISTRTTVQVTLTADPGTIVNSTSPHATGWPGDRVGCYLSGSYLVPGVAVSGTWADAGAWDSMGAWDAAVLPSSTMSYAQTIDMTTVAPRYVRVQHDSTGMTAIELCTSPDGANWTPWVPITAAAVSARYYQTRISLSGATAELRLMTISLYL